MLVLIKYIEKLIIWGILIVMLTIIALAFIDIVYEIVKEIIKEPMFIIDADGLMNLFSIFLVLLIGLELLETVKAYLKEDIVHVEFIILVAIIAIARKAIVWDFKKYTTDELIGLAVMIFTLGVTYFLIKKSDFKIKISRNQKIEKPEK